MDKLVVNAIYRVELCGSEARWQYLGQDEHAEPCWRDVETGREFRESGVMYAWQIIAKEDAASSQTHGRTGSRVRRQVPPRS